MALFEDDLPDTLERSDYSDRRPDAVGAMQNQSDRQREIEVASMIGDRWRCDVRPFPRFSPIDWFAARGDSMEALIELKCRSHTANHYPTVFLGASKWMALAHGALAFGCRGIFVVRFTDGVWWIDIDRIDTLRNRVCGGVRPTRPTQDILPAVEIPIGSLAPL